MRGSRGSSKADTLVKVTLVFFISLLSFSVGTFVGKQVSDSEHRKIALEGEYKGQGREVASESTEAEPGEDEADAGHISEKEVASLTEEFVSKEPEAGATEEHEGYKTYARKTDGREVAAEKPSDKAEHAGEHVTVAEHEAKPEHDEHAAAAPNEKHTAEKHMAAKPAVEKPAEAVHKLAGKLADKASDASHKIAEKVAEGKGAGDGEVEKPKAKPGLPSVESAAVGKYTVQVASFADEKDAKARATELKGKGYQSFYLSATVNGKVWYRVLLGMFATVKSAEEYKAKLIKEGGAKTALVQKIVP